MNVWLDDVREPWRFGKLGWRWAKTADEAIRLLKTGQVSEIDLDHDLGVPSILGDYEAEKTGYDVAKWMAENNVWPPNGVRCHSQNPVGRARIMNIVEGHSRSDND